MFNIPLWWGSLRNLKVLPWINMKKAVRLSALVFDRIIDVFVVITGITIIGLVIVVTVETLRRYFFDLTMLGIVEITEYSLVWMVFLTTAWVLRRDGHIRMDLILDRLSAKNVNRLDFVTSILGAIICLIMTYYGAKVSWNYFRDGILEMHVLHIPRSFLFSVIPLGFGMLFIQFLRKANEHWKRFAPTVK